RAPTRLRRVGERDRDHRSGRPQARRLFRPLSPHETTTFLRHRSPQRAWCRGGVRKGKGGARQRARAMRSAAAAANPMKSGGLRAATPARAAGSDAGLEDSPRSPANAGNQSLSDRNPGGRFPPAVRRLSIVVVPVVCMLLVCAAAGGFARAAYVNFESSHVHPLDLTPSGARLLAVNTPDALLEVFTVQADGTIRAQRSIPVGLEPVTVVARTDSEAWVVNTLSDTVSIVDLDLGTVTRTLAVGDEPTDVVFASGRAFVAVSQEDAVKVFSIADLTLPPVRVD